MLVPLLGLLAACAGGPQTPEQEARTDYVRIVEQANSVLFGEPLGYLGASGALDRSSVLCQGETCITTTTPPIRPNSFNIDEVDIELLPERGGVRPVIESYRDDHLAVDVYGIWLEHSLHGIQRIRYGVPEDLPAEPTHLFAYSVGSSTFDNPRSVDGSARWVGLMVGRDVTTSPQRGQLVSGDASVTVSFGEQAATADVAFFGILNLENGARTPDMAWRDLAIEDGGFDRRDARDDTISGRFYGPGHAEAGGVFERNGIVGAFGARRSPQ